jgi:serine/threonine-protein kinase
MAGSGRDPREATLPAVAPQSVPVETRRPVRVVPPDPSPRIRDEGVIARGGMGAVHRVYDRTIGRHAAMKVLDPVLAADPSVARRFVMEARVTGQLQHPNIVPVHDFAIDEDGVPSHFTMQLVDGETLGRAIERKPPGKRTDGDLWNLLQVFLKVCDAVSFAHSRGVVHCDLKPDNVMIGPYGQVYVMDWGIAHVHVGGASGVPLAIDAESAALVDSVVGGTAQYMAPEQAQGRVRDVDARTDVFALGGVLYTILTGRAPHDSESQAEALALARAAEIPYPVQTPGDIPIADSLCTIAMKALSKDPASRYPSVADLKRGVENVLRGGTWFGTQHFPAGTVILREGDAADSAYIIVTGRCEVFRTIDGVSTRIREMSSGEVFGEMAIVTDKPRSATVVARTDVTVVTLSKATLERELSTGSWLGALVNTLVRRFQDIESRTTPIPTAVPERPRDPRL